MNSDQDDKRAMDYITTHEQIDQKGIRIHDQTPTDGRSLDFQGPQMAAQDEENEDN